MTTESGHGVSRTVLPGGLRVVTEFLPAVRSVALGIWVGVGSRDEDPAHEGATHYLEHLLFKGTRRRTALEISAEMDAAGGEMNAFTAKEYTCYYARVLDADLPLAVDILSDMVTSSLITPKDVDAERNVVLEEIAMNEDDPADTAQQIVFLKRSMRPGFAGIDNALLYDAKTTMLFGDAKDTLSALVAAVKTV